MISQTNQSLRFANNKIEVEGDEMTLFFDEREDTTYYGLKDTSATYDALTSNLKIHKGTSLIKNKNSEVQVYQGKVSYKVKNSGKTKEVSIIKQIEATTPSGKKTIVKIKDDGFLGVTIANEKSKTDSKIEIYPLGIADFETYEQFKATQNKTIASAIDKYLNKNTAQ